MNSLFAQCNRSLREVKKIQKKLNLPSRLQTLATPEQPRRQSEEDLQRAYGKHSPFARAQAAPPVGARSPPASPLAQALAPPPPAPSPRDKCDVMAEPLVSSPNGLLTLDWSAVRPA